MSDIGTSNSMKVMEPARDNTKFAGIREGGGGVGVAAVAAVSLTAAEVRYRTEHCLIDCSLSYRA